VNRSRPEPVVLADVAGRLRVAVHRLTHALRAQSLHDGLTPSRLSALVLIDSEGPLRVSDLAASIGSSLSSTSRLADLLESAGWVRRHSDPSDQRASLLTLSPTGRALLTRLRRDTTTRLASAIAELSSDQLAALMSALPVLEALSELNRAADPSRGREDAPPTATAGGESRR
jgi:DNA-binding MarR family transcriptional regulator